MLWWLMCQVLIFSSLTFVFEQDKLPETEFNTMLDAYWWGCSGVMLAIVLLITAGGRSSRWPPLVTETSPPCPRWARWCRTYLSLSLSNTRLLRLSAACAPSQGFSWWLCPSRSLVRSDIHLDLDVFKTSLLTTWFLSQYQYQSVNQLQETTLPIFTRVKGEKRQFKRKEMLWTQRRRRASFRMIWIAAEDPRSSRLCDVITDTMAFCVDKEVSGGSKQIQRISCSMFHTTIKCSDL